MSMATGSEPRLRRRNLTYPQVRRGHAEHFFQQSREQQRGFGLCGFPAAVLQLGRSKQGNSNVLLICHSLGVWALQSFGGAVTCTGHHGLALACIPFLYPRLLVAVVIFLRWPVLPGCAPYFHLQRE